jgi:hypothetical protein
MAAVHQSGKAGFVAKFAAFLCFAIAVGLMIASLATSSPARAISAPGQSAAQMR